MSTAQRRIGIPLVGVLALLFAGSAAAVPVSGFIDGETGVAVSGYNDVKISGRAGTTLSFSDDLATPPTYFFRIRPGLTIAGRHTLFALVAPLRLEAAGTLPRDVHFDGVNFAKGERVRGLYRFDSYRLTYRYDAYVSDALNVGVGVSLKIRDAAIRLDGRESAEKRNTGFVPLLHFRLQWWFAEPWGLLVDGDALAGPQGRAEDVLVAFQVRFNRFVTGRLGYRILEGGADNREVYNFTLVHFGSAGIVASF